MGRPIMLLVPPGRRAESERLLESVRRGHHIRHFVTERLRKSGEIVHVSVSMAPIHDAAQRVAGAAEAARDIGEQLPAEESLRRSEERYRLATESANRAQDRLLATLSHELRTPLTPALVAVSRLEEDERLAPELHQQVAMVRRNVELEARRCAAPSPPVCAAPARARKSTR